MRALISPQQGKENDRLYIRSNKRKQSKSPLKFQQKIKQLQQKIQKQTKKISLTKDKPVTANPNNHYQPKTITSKQTIQPLSKQKGVRQSSPPKISMHSHSVKQLQTLPKSQPKNKVINKKTPQKQCYSRVGGLKVSEKTSLKSGEQQTITQLQQQNRRYKQIYTKSLQKMERLQTKLVSIKQQHQLQNGALEHTLHALKKQVQNKKYNITHAFSYKEENFILLKDKVIAETQNENSSTLLQNVEHHQKSSYSYLSIQSKQIY